MEIAFLVNRTEHASVYYRTLQYVPLLADEGLNSTVITLPNRFNSRRKLFGSLKRYDLVVLQRKLFNLLNFEPLRRAARKLVFDLDDALFVRDSKADKNYSLTRRLRFARTARRSDAVICGNEWIEEYTRILNPNRCVLPTAIDTEAYDPIKIHDPRKIHDSAKILDPVNLLDPGHFHDSKIPESGTSRELVRAYEKGQAFTAVWIGGKSTLFYLEAILPALEAVAARIPGFRLRVISDVFPSSETLYIDKTPWSRQTEVQALRECDVGLMPLVDDAWSKGKCGLKLLQYGAVGLPSICSPVGVNSKIVHHGESGFHAREAEDWQEALCALAENVDLRARMGQEARKIVEEGYSLNACFPRLLSFLRETAQK